MAQNNFKCKMCGRCCIKHYLIDIVHPDGNYMDWERIVEHIKEKYDGFLELHCNCGCGEVTHHKINSVKDLPLLELDYAKCPFLKRLRDNKGRFTSKYYCEIHEFKPQTCKEFPQNKEYAIKFSKCPGYD